MSSRQLAVLHAAFPQLDICDGYIGNCDFVNPARFDDRRWLVFTNLLRPYCLYLGSDRRVSIDIPGPDYDVEAVIRKIQSYIDKGYEIGRRCKVKRQS
jgi:hypothetical protein